MVQQVIYVAKHAFQGQPAQSQLAFPQGARITAKPGQEGKAWWWGSYGGRDGWFPPAYVTAAGPAPQPPSPANAAGFAPQQNMQQRMQQATFQPSVQQQRQQQPMQAAANASHPLAAMQQPQPGFGQ